MEIPKGKTVARAVIGHHEPPEIPPHGQDILLLRRCGSLGGPVYWLGHLIGGTVLRGWWTLSEARAEELLREHAKDAVIERTPEPDSRVVEWWTRVQNQVQTRPGRISE